MALGTVKWFNAEKASASLPRTTLKATSLSTTPRSRPADSAPSTRTSVFSSRSVRAQRARRPPA
ncbi:hypothetical protein AHiyo8_56700 [Arthrobacter sp. Hiyo8]|nr:hypothetical protein AHiyo8_56700 [Arthrobacter sp. Hiyo8]